MKLLAYIKLTLKQMTKSSLMFLFVFAVFPLLIGGFMAYFQRDIFTPSAQISKIEISIVDQDNTQLSQSMVSFFRNDSIKNIIEVKDKDTSYEIVIPKGYESNMENGKAGNIDLKVDNMGSTKSTIILSQLIDRYNTEVNQQILMSKGLEKMNLTQAEKTALINNINQRLTAAASNNAIKNNIVAMKRSLNSYEYYSVSLLGFAFIMLILSIVSGIFTERENGFYNRVISTTVSRMQYFNYSMAASYMWALLANILYVFIYRLLGLSFQGPLLLLILIILAQSLLATAAAAIVSAFFTKKTSTIFLNIIMFSQIIMGGTFFPFEKLTNNAFLKSLGSFSPDMLITRAYKAYLVYGSFDSIKFYLIAMVIVSMAIYLVSLLKVRIRWGER